MYCYVQELAFHKSCLSPFKMIRCFCHTYRNNNKRYRGKKRKIKRKQPMVVKKIVNQMWITSRTST